MGRIYAKAEMEQNKRLIDGINTRIEGRTKDGKISRDDMLEILEEAIKGFSAKPKTGGWDFSREKALPVLASDDLVSIRPIRPDDLDTYVSVRKQYAILKKLWEDDRFNRDSFDREVFSEACFFCIIEIKRSDFEEAPTAIGYIALKDTSREVWEVAIQLDQAYCGQGYGARAIPLFLREIRRLTGREEFQFTVEVDNLPCQKCMEKLGAKLVGLHETNSFETEEIRQKFEENNLDLIDGHILTLAEELQVEPRKLLSHVLDYRVAAAP